MSREYRAEQPVVVSGWECGTEFDLRLVVTFTVHPEEKPTLVDPGCARFAEVSLVRFFTLIKGHVVEVFMPPAVAEGFEESPGFKIWLLNEADSQAESDIDDAADHQRDRRAEDMR